MLDPGEIDFVKGHRTLAILGLERSYRDRAEIGDGLIAIKIICYVTISPDEH